LARGGGRSFTAKDTKDTKERKSFTAKDAKAAKELKVRKMYGRPCV
jgi:hypothetical protein